MERGTLTRVSKDFFTTIDGELSLSKGDYFLVCLRQLLLFFISFVEFELCDMFVTVDTRSVSTRDTFVITNSSRYTMSSISTGIMANLEKGGANSLLTICTKLTYRRPKKRNISLFQ